MTTTTEIEARYRDHEAHQLTIVQDVTVESNVTVDEHGDLRQEHGMDVIDTHEQSIWCTSCGLLNESEFADHGISDEWQIFC